MHKIEFFPAPSVQNRKKGEVYLYKEIPSIWLGKRWGCIHKKQRSQCVECGGSQMCIHKRPKSQCVECGGSNTCVHKKRKSQCVKCGGVQICAHKKRKHNCVECGGSQICVHKKQKSHCYICDINIHPQNFCQLCKYTYVRESSYKPHCFRCFCYLNPDKKIPRKFMMKENFIDRYLQNEFPNITIIHNRQIEGGCSSKRPDWSIHCVEYGIVIECDEDKHKRYTCENKRIMTMFEDFGNIPLVVLRFNPDEYENKSCFEFDEKNCISSTEEWDKRKIVLKNMIEHYLKNKPTKEVTLEYLFYCEDENIEGNIQIPESGEYIESDDNIEISNFEEDDNIDNPIDNLSSQISELKL